MEIAIQPKELEISRLRLQVTISLYYCKITAKCLFFRALVAGIEPRPRGPIAHMLDIRFNQPIQLANLHTRLHQRKVESFDQTNGPFR